MITDGAIVADAGQDEQGACANECVRSSIVSHASFVREQGALLRVEQSQHQGVRLRRCACVGGSGGAERSDGGVEP